MPRINLTSIMPRPLSEPRAYLATLAAAVRAEWGAQAREGLRASSKTTAAYINGIVADVGDTTATVTLFGLLPNMLEQGMGPGGVGTQGAYDLRVFLLKPGTRSVKQGKNGLYLHVPFNRTAATIKALGGDAAMKASRGLSAAVNPATTAGAGRLGAGFAPNLRPADVTRTDVTGAKFEARAHATDPLAGLVRLQTQYTANNAPQSTYRNFRTISQGGKPWMSPGIAARRLADRVMAAMPRIIAEVT